MAKRKPAFGGLSMSDGDLLEAALIGLERQRDSIMEKMAALRARLGIRGGGRASSAAIRFRWMGRRRPENGGGE
jgi:hypothetical protein